MAEAYQCDRCQELYEGSPYAALTLQSGYGRQHRAERNEVFNETLPPEPVDLCRSCVDDLRDWYIGAGGDPDDLPRVDD